MIGPEQSRDRSSPLIGQGRGGARRVQDQEGDAALRRREGDHHERVHLGQPAAGGEVH